MTAQEPLLDIQGLRVSVTVAGHVLDGVRGVDLTVRPGEIVGLIGESGSGKTLTLKAALNLLPPGCELADGEIRWRGEDLRGASASRWRETRKSGMCYVPADSSSMNPVFHLDDQMVESLVDRVWPFLGRRLRSAISRSLRAVGLGQDDDDAIDISRRFPHELSGGMRQRALIAMALARDGGLLIADEPTSGLDLTTQRQVLQLLANLRDETGMALLVTSHDLELVGDIADRVIVMYGGEVVEEGSRDQIFRQPRHPYTVGLLGCIPPMTGVGEELLTIPGAPPRLEQMPQGCTFRPRCSRFTELDHPEACWEEAVLEPDATGTSSARCHYADRPVEVQP